MVWRLIHWSIELSEFDIGYHPQTILKGQVMVDFVAKFTFREKDPRGESDYLKDKVSAVDNDGSSSKRNSGVGLVLVSLD